MGSESGALLYLYDRAETNKSFFYSPVGKLGDNFVDNSAEARFKVA
jgi:hypothetical protein